MKLRYYILTKVYSYWNPRDEEWIGQRTQCPATLQKYNEELKKWEDIPTVREEINA